MPTGLSRTSRLAVELLESRDVPSRVGIVGSNLTTVPAVPPNPGWLALHQKFVEIAQHRNPPVLFVGDSITAHWRTLGAATWGQDFVPVGAADFGIRGDTTQNVLWRVENGELSGRPPRVVVLLIGTNNLHANTPAQIAAGVSAIVQAIHTTTPTTKILLIGILPRGGPGDTALHAHIAYANRLLRHLDNHHTVRFVDAGAPFLRADGSVRTNLMPDGLHPSAAGYQVLAETIAPVLQALLHHGPRHV